MNLEKSKPRQNERRPSFWSGSLRTRLLITSITLVAIPVLITGIVAALISSRGLRSEVFGQLESVATLKDNQIQTWLESLQTNLDLVFSNPVALDGISTYVTNPDSEGVNPSQLRSNIVKYNQRSGYFTEIFVMNLDGRVVLSTDAAQEGKILHTQTFFLEGAVGPNITPPLYELSLQNYSIIISQPLQNKFGRTIGVLAGRANLDTLNQIMSQRAGLGETGETYVINSNNAVLTSLRFEELTLGQTYINTQGVANVVQQKANGSATYPNYRDATVLGVYHWVPELQIAVLAEQDESEALASVNRLLQVAFGLIVVTILAAVLAAYLITQSITSPITKLAQAAQEISRGNLEQSVEVVQRDEIGVLANSFNLMTTQLRTLISTLEQRVADRTAALTHVAEISTATSSIRNLEKMLETFVHLTQRRFGLYHAHVFLFDEKTESLNIITCGWKEGDEHEGTHGTTSIPLQQEQSLVARAARLKNAVIVNDVHSDPGWLPNPLLPDTASEMAVPLLVGDEVLGVLDVQSDQMNAFTESDANIQTTLASQVAISVQNAELYTRVDTALQDTRALIENAPEAIIVIDLATGLFVDPNENAKKLYGLPYDELIKVGPAQMSPPKQPDGRDSVEKAMEKINEAVKGGKPVFDWIHRNAQGHDFPCEVRLVLMPGDHPRVRASVTDITQRKHDEEVMEKRAKELAAVAEVSTISSQELDIQKMLESVVHLTQRRFGLYHAHVFLFNENSQDLAIAACGWKEGDEHEGTHGTTAIQIEQEQSLVARAARTRQAVIVNDVRNEPGWLPNPLLPDTASELAVPMIVGDQLLGVLDVQSDRLNAFSEEDANIQTTLASQVATALQNAQSFSKAQLQAQRESALNIISQKIQSATTVEAVLQIAARELGHALGAPMTVAQLGMKDTSS